MRYLSCAAFAALALMLGFLPAQADAGPGEFERLIEEKGPDVIEVLEEPTLYRVAEMKGLPCSAGTFEFLIDRPRISMVLARSLDPAMDEYEIQVGPDGSCHVDDNGRLVGDMDLVDAGPGRRLYYMTGHWKFVFGITFTGRMVLVPEYSEIEEDGRTTVDARARGYMKIDSALVGLMARLVAFVFPGKVDARIERFQGSVRKVAEAVRDDPAGMYAVLISSGKVTPREAGEYRAMFLSPGSGG